MCDCADLALAVAVDEQVGLGIQQDRAAHLLRPVVEVSDAPKGSFDATNDDWNVLESLTCALRVDNHGAIRSLSALTAGRVCVVASDSAIRGVAIDHGVHVAGRDAEEQVWSSEGTDRIGAVPISLAHDTHADPFPLQNTTHHRH